MLRLIPPRLGLKTTATMKEKPSKTRKHSTASQSASNAPSQYASLKLFFSFLSGSARSCSAHLRSLS